MIVYAFQTCPRPRGNRVACGGEDWGFAIARFFFCNGRYYRSLTRPGYRPTFAVQCHRPNQNRDSHGAANPNRARKEAANPQSTICNPQSKEAPC